MPQECVLCYCPTVLIPWLMYTVQVIWLISLNLPFVVKDPASTLNYTDKSTHKFWSHFLHRFCPWPELRFYRSTGSTVQIPWLYVFSDHLAHLTKYPHLPDKYIQKNCATCSDNLNKPVPTTWHNYFFTAHRCL